VTAAFFLGGLAGLGLFLLGYALYPPRPSLARQPAAFDAAWQGGNGRWTAAGNATDNGLRAQLGGWLERLCAEHGFEFPSLRANLSLTGSSLEIFLATKVLLGVSGLILGPALALLARVAGLKVPSLTGIWLGVVLGAVFFLLPDPELRRKATARRRDFRYAVRSFLDLVAMNLSGGRGVPEALMAAADVGTSWAFWWIRDALAAARLTGLTPWQTLGELGEETGVDELRDLAALSPIAEDGAKVRESLVARAAAMRQRELADLQGQARERSQSMLAAQLLLCAGFLLFLVYPVVGVLLSA
jgi:hypothetical protein